MTIEKRLEERIEQYKELTENEKQGNLTQLVREVEIIEEVFHSNAIENSTLSMKDTERILLEMQIEGSFNIREIYEAKNLYRVYNYIEEKSPPVTSESILLIHEFLLTNINDSIAGRIRRTGENVRVGTYVAPRGEYVFDLLNELLSRKIETLRDVTRFHLDFERIHPFNDGNGRIGRVLINWQLAHLSLPAVIIRSDTKFKDYYPHLKDVNYDGFERELMLRLIESLNKRIAHFSNGKIIPLSEYSTKHRLVHSQQLDKARRMTIPAFRLHGRWSIGVD